MVMSKDEALAMFRSWQELKPALEVVLRISALAVLHFRCEEVEVSEDKLTLWFGRIAWGSGNLTLPMNLDMPFETTVITELKPDNSEGVARWVQFKFSNGGIDDGCMITEYKPNASFFITGISPLDVAVHPKSNEQS